MWRSECDATRLHRQQIRMESAAAATAVVFQQFREQLSTVETVVDCCAPSPQLHIGGCYVSKSCSVAIMAARQLFAARPTDLILATIPKSGTTWLSALIFAIANRDTINIHSCADDPDHPMSKHNPHELVLSMEYWLYRDEHIVDAKLSSMVPPKPRLIATHVPYGDLLPKSIVDSDCRIIYCWRDPKANFVSLWHFSQHDPARPPIPLETAFQHFCNGVSYFGPFWDHVMGYWKASLERPDKVLFLKYEGLMEDTGAAVRRVAEFIGFPFSEGEERSGVVDSIVKLCGFESLTSLEVNKSGKTYGLHANENFFREGKVGDWVNYLTPEMARRIDEITASKFAGSGLAV